MDDQEKESMRALVEAGYIPHDEYVRELARTARGANELRPKVIEAVARNARSGRESNTDIIDAVTTVAMIDRACNMPPCRLIHTGSYDVSGEGEV